MEKELEKRISTVKFWDIYARWYKLWIEHTRYHERIIEVLKWMIQPNWKVLDIGAGNGILSIPLYARGCEVTALEPSNGIRNLLYEEVSKNRIDGIHVDERTWEEVSCHDYLDYDLIIACNSLHLTPIGFEGALAKVFYAKPRNVFLVFEPASSNLRVREFFGDYTLFFKQSYEIDNSFAYHHLGEIIEHWSFMKGRYPHPDELDDLRGRIIFHENHLWIKHISRILICWWKNKK